MNVLVPLPGSITPIHELDVKTLDVREIRIPIMCSCLPAVEFSDLIPPYTPYRIFTLESKLGGCNLYLERSRD